MSETFFKQMRGNKLTRHGYSFWEISNIKENIILHIHV